MPATPAREIRAIGERVVVVAREIKWHRVGAQPPQKIITGSYVHWLGMATFNKCWFPFTLAHLKCRIQLLLQQPTKFCPWSIFEKNNFFHGEKSFRCHPKELFFEIEFFSLTINLSKAIFVHPTPTIHEHSLVHLGHSLSVCLYILHTSRFHPIGYFRIQHVRLYSKQNVHLVAKSYEKS